LCVTALRVLVRTGLASRPTHYLAEEKEKLRWKKSLVFSKYFYYNALPWFF
jgi:hypothetical protein